MAGGWDGWAKRGPGGAAGARLCPVSDPAALLCAADLGRWAGSKEHLCLARDEYAFVSQHIGDMENLETAEHLEATLALYRHLFRLEPEVIACDLHPDYATTRFALEQAGQDKPVVRVQHHHAHIAACLADNGWAASGEPVIGVALDGTGYGQDGAIWGGEWLVGGYTGFRRAAHLQYLPLPGGDTAIRHPWRIAAAYIYSLLGADAVPARLFSTSPRATTTLYRQIDRRLNAPLTSSMGRLFDAASALLGVCHTATYEAQAAIELEQAALEVGMRALKRRLPWLGTDRGGLVVGSGRCWQLLEEMKREPIPKSPAGSCHRRADDRPSVPADQAGTGVRRRR